MPPPAPPSPRAALVLGAAAFVLFASIAAIVNVPAPQVHDEFSYLLAADTFAHGRLTNPSPPDWRHFEAPHVLLYPTYMSKYQPGQGLLLALGQITSGLPIAGVWLAGALLVAGVYVAASAYLPRPWPVVAAGFALFHPILLQWTQNYWGGALSALGGALVLAAVGWLRPATLPAARPLWRCGLALGLGIALLALTRPYEGGVLVFLLLLTHWRIVRRFRRPTVLAACAAPLLLAATFQLYYNARLTGSPWQLPYLLYETQYAAAPPFLWQSPPAPKTYENESIRAYNLEHELPHFLAQRSPRGFLAGAAEKFRILAPFLLWAPGLAAGSILLLPAFLDPNRDLLKLILPLGAFGLALLLSNWTYPHYAAPGFALLILLGTAGLARMGIVGIVKAGLIGATVAGAVVASGIWLVGYQRHFADSFGEERQKLIELLRLEPGDDLVLVREMPGHDANINWVYNPAELRSAGVLFARDRGPENNADLRRHYPDRRLWLLVAGPKGSALEPIH